MEISVDDKREKEKDENVFFHKFLTLFGFSLGLSLIAFAFYIIERYILLLPISLFLKILFGLLFINSKKYELYFIISSLLIVAFLQILFLKIFILSKIFLGGGIFGRFTFYDSFENFINLQRELAKQSIDCLYFSSDKFSINDLSLIMNKIAYFQKAFNNLKTTKYRTLEKQNQLGYYLNEVVIQYKKFKEENYNSYKTKNNLIKNLKLYKKNLESYINYSIFDIIMKFNYKETLELFKELLLISFNNRTCFIVKISDNFNAYIISPENRDSEIKSLVIFCGQNSFNAEISSFSHNILNFYLNIKEATIMLWNYKGYGLRQGFPTFNSIDKDVENLKEYIIKYYDNYKIIIHGISIGGYASIKLANSLKCKRNVCLIADRTYADIDLVIETIIKNGKNIYNILFPKIFYKTDNIHNYIDIPIGNKIILYDEKDIIINYSQSSLIYHLTKKYYNEIVIPKINYYNQYKNIINYTSVEHTSLQIELKRIKNYAKRLDENTFDFINKLLQNIDELQNFLMYFLVFGYPYNQFKEINYDKTIFAKNYINLPIIMKNIIEKNKFKENLKIFISDLNFLFIKSNLFIPFNDEEIISFSYHNDNKDFSLQEGFQENLLKYFGYVRRIFCNHNGILENEDKGYLKKFFEVNQFICDSNAFVKEESYENNNNV